MISALEALQQSEKAAKIQDILSDVGKIVEKAARDGRTNATFFTRRMGHDEYTLLTAQLSALGYSIMDNESVFVVDNARMGVSMRIDWSGKAKPHQQRDELKYDPDYYSRNHQ